MTSGVLNASLMAAWIAYEGTEEREDKEKKIIESTTQQDIESSKTESFAIQYLTCVLLEPYPSSPPLPSLSLASPPLPSLSLASSPSPPCPLYQLHPVELVHQCHVSTLHLGEGGIELLQLVQCLLFRLFILLWIQLISDGNGCMQTDR